MPSTEFELPRKGRTVVVVLGSILWGASLCAAQGTPVVTPLDTRDPPTILADQMASVVAASVAQEPAEPDWIAERRA